MSRRKLEDAELDRLLRDALVGDVPPSVEDELRARLRPSWRELGAASIRVEPLRPRWMTLVPQPLLAAAAVVLLVAGGALQAAGTPRSAATALAMAQTSMRTARALARAVAMDATLDGEDGHGGRIRYRVAWRAGKGTTVWVDRGTGETQRNVPAREPGARVLDLAALRAGSAGEAGLSEIDEARAVEGYFSPRGIAELLTGTWYLEGGAAGAANLYVVDSDNRPLRVRVLLEERRDLPARIEEVLPAGGRGTTAVFRWGGP